MMSIFHNTHFSKRYEFTRSNVVLSRTFPVLLSAPFGHPGAGNLPALPPLRPSPFTLDPFN